MALEIRRSPAARRDLIEVWTYIADDNERAADALLDRFDQVLRMLADNPEAGRARPELAEALRSMPVGNYVLFYRSTGTTLELVRVRSGYLDTTGQDFE